MHRIAPFTGIKVFFFFLLLVLFLICHLFFFFALKGGYVGQGVADFRLSLEMT